MGIDKDPPAMRVLVIDDNPVNLKITAALTRRAGSLVDTADNAERALEQLRKNRPNLIVTDLHLTGMDGLDFTRAVKRIPAWASIPVILLTADNSKDVAARAREAGCAWLLGKPVDAQLFPGVMAGFLHTPVPLASENLADDLPLEGLRQEFLVSGAEKCRSILWGFTSQRLLVPAVDYVSLRQELHRWAGVGGTLGFANITRQARAVEALTDTADPDRRRLREAILELLDHFTYAVPVNPPPGTREEILPAAAGAAARKPLVLVADDDATIRAVIRLSLEAAGIECHLANNGALACTMARTDPPDAIILDVNMPRMNGFQVLYALRNQWSTRQIPVILLTARREPADILQASQLGVAAYMIKPFDVNNLLARLNSVIERSVTPLPSEPEIVRK